MKKRVRFALFVLAAVSVLSVCGSNSSQAADLTTDQLDLIKANCLSIKGSLNQLHASDALLRVNRGQIYESMGTKLMNSFNGRLNNNSLDNKGLVAVTTTYQSTLAIFRTDYQAYEQQLSATIKVDCTKDPGGFHDSLEQARTKRATVRTDIIRLNQYIDDYRSAVNDFMLNFERVTGQAS